MLVLTASTEAQREPFYEDLIRIIENGHLSTTIRIRGTPITIRSLSSDDFDFIQRSYSRDWRHWVVARSITQIKGVTSLDTHEVASMLAKASPYLSLMLYRLQDCLLQRARTALDGLQAFLYESRSRQMWAQTGKGRYINPSHIAQKVWVAANIVEDTRLEEEMLWNLTKSSISPHAPKALKKINAQDEARSEKERNRRQSVMDDYYYLRTGVITHSHRRNDVLSNIPTRGSLQEDFERWVKGEEDSHDAAVRQYKETILQGIEAEREYRRRQIEEARKEVGERESVIIGYTAEQVDTLFKDRQHRKVYETKEIPSSVAWLLPAVPPTVEDLQKAYSLKPDLMDQVKSRTPSIE